VIGFCSGAGKAEEAKRNQNKHYKALEARGERRYKRMGGDRQRTKRSTEGTELGKSTRGRSQVGSRKGEKKRV